MKLAALCPLSLILKAFQTEFSDSYLPAIPEPQRIFWNCLWPFTITGLTVSSGEIVLWMTWPPRQVSWLKLWEWAQRHSTWLQIRWTCLDCSVHFLLLWGLWEFREGGRGSPLWVTTSICFHCFLPAILLTLCWEECHLVVEKEETGKAEIIHYALFAQRPSRAYCFLLFSTTSLMTRQRRARKCKDTKR